MVSRSDDSEVVAAGEYPNGCVCLVSLLFSQCVLICVLLPASNPCASNNGGCEQVCVLSHRTDNGGLGYRCKCEFGFELDTDERHCVGKKFALPVFPVDITWFVCAYFGPDSLSFLRRVQCSLGIETFKLKIEISLWFFVQGFFDLFP